MRPELRKRLILGPLLIIFVVIGFMIDFRTGAHYGFLVLLLIGTVSACREFSRMATEVAGPMQPTTTLLVCLIMPIAAAVAGNDAWESYLAAHIPGIHRVPLVPVILGLALAWTVVVQMVRWSSDHFFTSVGLTLFGMIYLGVTTYLMYDLAQSPSSADYYGTGVSYANRGNQMVLLSLACCKMGDVTAYFGGRAFGRHKLAPQISPGKTWEGVAFGLLGSVAATYLVAGIFTLSCEHGPFNSWWKPIVWGLVIGPFGVIGDLAESCMKRQASRKDSGTAIPGFGGWLDVFDALIISTPVAYVLALVL